MARSLEVWKDLVEYLNSRYGRKSNKGSIKNKIILLSQIEVIFENHLEPIGFDIFPYQENREFLGFGFNLDKYPKN